jgi:hypothetical protein
LPVVSARQRLYLLTDGNALTVTMNRAVTRGIKYLPKIAYVSMSWSWRWDLNPQPADYKSAALPIELRQLTKLLRINYIISLGK